MLLKLMLFPSTRPIALSPIIQIVVEHLSIGGLSSLVLNQTEILNQLRPVKLHLKIQSFII